MDIKQFVQIVVKSTNDIDYQRASMLAAEVGLDTVAALPAASPFYLSFNNGRLELAENTAGHKYKANIYIDFLSGATWFRYKHDRRLNQPLTKAVGIKKGARPTICDTTAGYGADSFIFASFGSTVTMIERSPVIWALLDDGLKRAAAHPEIGSMISSNISLVLGDSLDLLEVMDKKFDTIYMDPMYPPTKKTALNKRRMRVLRSLVGDDHDNEKLLEKSIHHTGGRVVVKRPAGAPEIKGPPVSYQVKGKNSRYDIYLARHL